MHQAKYGLENIKFLDDTLATVEFYLVIMMIGQHDARALAICTSGETNPPITVTLG